MGTPANRNPDNPKFKRIDAKQQIAVMRLLDANWKIISPETESSPAVGEYINGYTDARIAQEALSGYPGNGAVAVQAFRRRAGYGNVREFRGNGHTSPNQTAEIEGLRVNMAKMGIAIDEMGQQIEAMDDDLLDRIGRIEAAVKALAGALTSLRPPVGEKIPTPTASASAVKAAQALADKVGDR